MFEYIYEYKSKSTAYKGLFFQKQPLGNLYIIFRLLMSEWIYFERIIIKYENKTIEKQFFLNQKHTYYALQKNLNFCLIYPLVHLFR